MEATMPTIVVDAKVMGQKRPLIHDWEIPLGSSESGAAHSPGSLTLQDLITRVVRSEVVAFRERQEQRRLTRFLTQAQIEQAAARGKIEMGGSDLDQPVDVQEAVQTALQAFQDGIYLVFVDGEQQQSLAAPVHLQDHSRVSFIRLMMLAGG